MKVPAWKLAFEKEAVMKTIRLKDADNGKGYVVAVEHRYPLKTIAFSNSFRITLDEDGLKKLREAL